MNPILYFKSGCTLGVNIDAAKQMGLGYAFQGTPNSREFSANSPSGRPGNMFADNTRMNEGEQPEYDGDKQTWVKMPEVPGRPELWVGCWNDRKPGPRDLARAKTLKGYFVDLLDGARWLIPAVTDYESASGSYSSALPCYVSFDAQGKPKKGATVAVYRRLWDLVAPLASAKLAIALGQKPDVELTDEAMALAAVELLKTNYCVELPEIALLQLIDDETIASVIDAASRYQALLLWLEQETAKKKGDASIPNGSDTSGGAAA